MDKLYRLVQADGFCFKAFGVTVGVRVSQSSAISRIQAQLPPTWSLLETEKVDRLYSFIVHTQPSSPGIRRFHLLYGNSQNLARIEDDERLFDAFETDLNLHIATTARTRFFVHAGVVGWQGKAIVIPGRSYTGKTTLVKEFLRQGATYYSDEFAVFDLNGCVHPFAKPLGVRQDATQKQTRVSANSLGCAVGVKPLQPGLILFTRYEESARWLPKPLSRGRAVLSLLGNAFSVRENPEAALTFAEKAVRHARILAGVRGGAEEVVSTILEGATMV